MQCLNACSLPVGSRVEIYFIVSVFVVRETESTNYKLHLDQRQSCDWKITISFVLEETRAWPKLGFLGKIKVVHSV